MKLRFKVIDKPQDADWNQIESTYDCTIYKTTYWFDFLFAWKIIKPLVISIYSDTEHIGYFVGERIKRIVRIVASPFEGIATSHQGLCMFKPCSSEERLKIYTNLSEWLFKNNICSVFQVEDWQLSMEDMAGSSVYYEGHDGYYIDLQKPIDELYRNLHQKSCRYSINKSKRLGVKIQQTNDVSQFVEIYYNQLKEVFGKQGLTPTYSIDCIKSLINALYPSHLLLLEAITEDGEVAATGIFPGDKNFALFFGGASYQKFQYLCPNEPLIWEAICIWKSKGTKLFDMCGTRPYKLKFGPIEYTKPRLIFSSPKILVRLKVVAKKLYYLLRKLQSKFNFK